MGMAINYRTKTEFQSTCVYFCVQFTLFEIILISRKWQAIAYKETWQKISKTNWSTAATMNGWSMVMQKDRNKRRNRESGREKESLRHFKVMTVSCFTIIIQCKIHNNIAHSAIWPYELTSTRFVTVYFFFSHSSSSLSSE